MAEYCREHFKRAKRKTSDNSEFIQCPSCGGAGEFYTSHRSNCDDCNCTGWVEISIYTKEMNRIEDFKYKRDLIAKIDISAVDTKTLERVLKQLPMHKW